jgi:serine/threonine protein kinase
VNLSARDLNGPCGQAFVDVSVQLGRGATATVHPSRLNGQRYAAKIFNGDRFFPTAKIVAMLANPPKGLSDKTGDAPAGRLAWPIAILSDDKGKDVGFLMPELDLKVAFPLDYFYDQTLFKKLKSPNEAALSFKLEIARNLSRLVADLHEQGHCFIDMKPQNIRVTLGSHEVCLLDCDGFSIAGPQGGVQLACPACGKKNRVPTARLCEEPTCGKCSHTLVPNAGGSTSRINVGSRFPAELLSTDYISPEAFRGNIPPSALGEPQDRYALAVLLFQLLNRGTHPFQGIPLDDTVEAATNDEKAARGLYPHGLQPHPSLKPRPHSIHEQFDDGLRSLFDNAFLGNANYRPSASDWANKLDLLLISKALVRCDKFPSDISHIKFKEKQCPACYLASVPQVTMPKIQINRPPESKDPISLPRPKPKPPEPDSVVWKFIFGLLMMTFIIGIVVDCSNKLDAPAPVLSPSSTPAPVLAPANSPALSCADQVLNKTPSQLCDLYWGHKVPHCDSRIRSELIRLRSQIHPQESCGLPVGFVKDNPASQESQLGYFSIFVSANRTTGWALGESSQQMADSQAKSQCRVQAGSVDSETCKRLTSGQARCIAIAHSRNGALGASSGKSITVASNDATEQCIKSGGQDCEVPAGGVICQ